MAGAGEGHIQQAQVFLQTLFIGRRQSRRAAAEVELRRGNGLKQPAGRRIGQRVRLRVRQRVRQRVGQTAGRPAGQRVWQPAGLRVGQRLWQRAAMGWHNRAGRSHHGEAAAAGFRPPKVAGKRQADHRVLQPLGLVHRHHLDQIGIAFQAQHLLIDDRGGRAGGGAAAGIGHLLGQPAHQRTFTVDLRAGGLQQFGKVQHIAQPALAVGLLQPALRQAQPVQGLAQHGQHALALPDALQLGQLRGALLKGVIVLRQVGQLGQRQAQRAAGQRGAGGAAVGRVGHGLQPQAQVSRLGRGQH